MQVIADGVRRPGWALRNIDTDVIALSTVCASEGEVRRLHEVASSAQAHMRLEAIAVVISVEVVPT